MRFLVLLFALILEGCSPPGVTISATIRGNDVVFTASVATSPLPFSRHTVVLQPDLVRVDAAAGTVWRIERKRDRSCIDAKWNGSSLFPLTYGSVPPCFVEVVQAQPLLAGNMYRIAAVGGQQHGKALGNFDVGLTVENIDGLGEGTNWNSVEPLFNVEAPAAGANATAPHSSAGP